MPPKRRPPASNNPPAKKATRQSALAKEHDISATTEASIKEIYAHFAGSTKKDVLLASSDFKRALAALNIASTSNAEYRDLLSAADPEDEGVIPYANFVAVAALKINAQGEDEKNREVEEAFDLFLRMGGAPTTQSKSGGVQADEGMLVDGKITIAMLKRIAILLKEDISDDGLRDMVLEANGGAGVGKGVSTDDFENVMRRAGVFRS